MRRWTAGRRCPSAAGRAAASSPSRCRYSEPAGQASGGELRPGCRPCRCGRCRAARPSAARPRPSRCWLRRAARLSTAWIAGWPRRLRPPVSFRLSFGSIGEAGAVRRLEVGDRGWPSRLRRPRSSPSTENGSQLVGLSVKSGRSRLTPDRAGPQRDPFEDLRQRIGDRGHLSGDRVDRDRRPGPRRCRGRRARRPPGRRPRG